MDLVNLMNTVNEKISSDKLGPDKFNLWSDFEKSKNIWNGMAAIETITWKPNFK